MGQEEEEELQMEEGVSEPMGAGHRSKQGSGPLL